MILGIKNGMVMQRNSENVADITVTSDTPLTFVNYTGFCSGEAAILPLKTVGTG